MTDLDDRSTDVEVVRREAMGWVDLLTSGRATPQDAASLRRWRERSPLHVLAYAEAARLWRAIGPAAANLRARGEIPAGLRTRRVTQGIDRRLLIGGAALAAASAAAAAVIAPPLDLWPSLTELSADYRTRKGEQIQLALASDVSVRLNTQTSLALRPSGDATDRVELVAGEASFTAPPRAQRPLVVLAADGEAQASGAHFDVRRLGAAVCVTCLRGEVRVAQRGRAETIAAGRQVRYGDAGLGPVATVDPELATAWQQGVLIFRLTPLAEVIEEVNRYRSGRVILLNDELARRPVSGRFRIDHMDDILVRLEQAFGAKSRVIPGGIVLVS